MGMTHPGRQNDHMVTFPAREGAYWRAMDSRRDPNRGVKRWRLTAHSMKDVYVCAAKQAASPLTCVLQPPCTLTGHNTAGAGQHRLIRSAPSGGGEGSIEL